MALSDDTKKGLAIGVGTSVAASLLYSRMNLEEKDKGRRLLKWDFPVLNGLRDSVGSFRSDMTKTFREEVQDGIKKEVKTLVQGVFPKR